LYVCRSPEYQQAQTVLCPLSHIPMSAESRPILFGLQFLHRGAVIMSSIISVAANETEDKGKDSSFSQSLGDAAAQEAARTGARIVDRELSVRPTLKVRAGAPVRVLVSKDIQLRPYQD